MSDGKRCKCITNRWRTLECIVMHSKCVKIILTQISLSPFFPKTVTFILGLQGIGANSIKFVKLEPVKLFLLISHKTRSSQIRGCESKALIISLCVSFRISSTSMASLSEVVTLRFFAAKHEKKEATSLKVKNSLIVNTHLPISCLEQPH